MRVVFTEFGILGLKCVCMCVCVIECIHTYHLYEKFKEIFVPLIKILFVLNILA